MITRLLPPPEPAPKSGTEGEWSRWIELDEMGQMADAMECMGDIHAALKAFHFLVRDSSCEAEKKDWLFYQLKHIHEHVCAHLKFMQADMRLRDN